MENPEFPMQQNESTASWLEKAKDPSPATRRAAALAMRDKPLKEAREVLTEVARQYPPGDKAYLDDLATGCTGKEEPMYAHLLGRLGAMTLKWSDAFADIACRLHPVTSVFALKDRALATSLPQDRRQQAIDALSAINHKTAIEALKEIKK